MGRYLIIDTEECHKDGMGSQMLLDMVGYRYALNEEESMAKFKEIWGDGFACGATWEADKEDYFQAKEKDFEYLKKQSLH